eukprot:TRINITY_DN459_c0_g1_i1.p1 TRINITY_DN459_c0_g1~~TRINITY_DN459_c0_g1_i1.p1  ORF type:complete len:117 (-),score=38.74 TRINITY_DN459_c0_g1_i1:42-392(-)
MSKQQQGIKKLLQAEQKAQELIAKARRDKGAKLKQAKDEAEKEIDAYRARREAEYAEYEGKFGSTSVDYAKQLEVKTEQEIREMQQGVKQGRDPVIQMLLECVANVNLDYNEHELN